MTVLFWYLVKSDARLLYNSEHHGHVKSNQVTGAQGHVSPCIRNTGHITGHPVCTLIIADSRPNVEHDRMFLMSEVT